MRALGRGQHHDTHDALAVDDLAVVRDGDVGVIMAVGFPAFTGGPFTYIDNYGLSEFVRDADALSARYGARFEPPKLLRDMAAEGRTFYS